jgi:hypothetical protein
MEQASDFLVRPMTRTELDLAVEWAAEEGWNPGLSDADCFYSTDPEGWSGRGISAGPAGLLAAQYGLAPVFETARMYCGPAPSLPLDQIYGITTFELG